MLFFRVFRIKSLKGKGGKNGTTFINFALAALNGVIGPHVESEFWPDREVSLT